MPTYPLKTQPNHAKQQYKQITDNPKEHKTTATMWKINITVIEFPNMKATQIYRSAAL